MIWAHVASGNVASKTGGISFNLVFFLERMVRVHDQTGSSLCLSTQENFNLPVDLCDGATANL